LDLNCNPLISASWVASIIGVSQQNQVEISVFIKGIPENSLTSFHHMRIKWEVSNPQPKIEPSEPNYAGTLTSDIQLQEPWEINLYCFKATQLMVFYYNSQL
jgi:hypothetical protein